MSGRKKAGGLLPEWSHKINVAEIMDEPLRVHIEASHDEARDLARRLNVSRIDDLAADLTLTRENRRGPAVHVHGRFSATVTQPCVVTLVPVREEVSEELNAWFREEGVVFLSRERRERESMGGNVEIPIAEEYEDPEPVIGGEIDLGELVAQYLSLAINPYPHAEGVTFEAAAEGDKAGQRENPFAALKDWKAARDRKK